MNFKSNTMKEPATVKYHRPDMWSRRSMILDTNPQHEFYAHFEKVKAELDKNKEHWENRDSVVLRVNKILN